MVVLLLNRFSFVGRGLLGLFVWRTRSRRARMIAWGKIPKIVSWGREIQNNKLLTKGKVAGKGTASAKSHVEICSHLMRYQKGD
jgi:hypothetical protein